MHEGILGMKSVPEVQALEESKLLDDLFPCSCE